MLKLFKIDLLCNICGAKQGEHVVSSEFGWTEETATAENCGFIDTRCDQCKIDHGIFSEMVEEAFSKLKIGILEAEELVKKHRKKSEFDKEVEKFNKK